MDNQFEKYLNSNDWFFIHYASDGFYNGTSPSPKISCILIYNYKNEEAYKFEIADHLDGNSLEEAERLTLEHFSTLFTKKPNICFIHWNMQAEGFGFKAIQARAKEFGIDIPILDNNRLFDLASYVEYFAGKKLSIKQVLWFNSILNDKFLDGKTEAEYFEKRKFLEIYNSVHSKILGLAFIVEELRDGTLKTEKPYAEPNDGLTKKGRREQALKIAQAREEMLKDIVKHNKRILKRKEKAFEEFVENYEPKYKKEHGLFFFDSAHPIISLFASWFANRK